MTSPYRQVLQQAPVFLQLVLERLVSDGPAVLRVRVLEQCHGQVVDLLLAEAQVILFHARLDHVLQLPVLDQPVTLQTSIYTFSLNICFRGSYEQTRSNFSREIRNNYTKLRKK